MSAEKTGTEQAAGVSRRRFLGTAAAAAAGMIVAPASATRLARGPGYVQGARPNSNFRGVQIGAITYSYRSMPSSAEQLLGYLVDSGISSTELMGPPILEYLGAPTTDAPSPGQISRMTDPAEREAAQRARAAHEAEMVRWYASPPMEKLAALRKLYNDAGVASTSPSSRPARAPRPPSSPSAPPAPSARGG